MSVRAPTTISNLWWVSGLVVSFESSKCHKKARIHSLTLPDQLQGETDFLQKIYLIVCSGRDNKTDTGEPTCFDPKVTALYSNRESGFHSDIGSPEIDSEYLKFKRKTNVNGHKKYSISPKSILEYKNILMQIFKERTRHEIDL